MSAPPVPGIESLRTGKRPNLIRMLPWLKPHALLFALIFLLILLINAADLLRPYLLKTVIDDHLVSGAATADPAPITRLSLFYFGLVAVSASLHYLQALLVTLLGQSLLMSIRRSLFHHILRLPMSFLDHYASGRLITRATNDVETLNEFFTDVLVNLLRDVVLLSGIVIVMVSLDLRLALISFLTVPLIVMLTLFVRGRLRRNFVRLKSLIGRINAFFAENISGIRLIQMFAREPERRATLGAINTEYARRSLTQIRLNSLLRPLMEVINTLGIVLLVWLSLNRILGGSLPIGVLYAFTTYIRQFFDPINDLAEKYSTIQSAAVSADRIFELLDCRDGLEDLESGEMLGEIAGRVEFEDVWFAYEKENWVLKGLSFVLEPGQSAAIVGPTGAGKTTIISLLLRFYPLERGRILLDGRDIRTLNLRDLRSRIAVVLQDVFLFSGSIAENIRLGDERIDDAMVSEALRLAQADVFIDQLDERLETPVSERGSTFSAGQRQLLSFARAIARRPALFILDEATAQIDSETEEQIQSSIETLSRGRTTIIIAHRLSTIRNCDVIMVLDQGRLVESGRHDQLVAASGRYAQLIAAQTAEGTLRGDSPDGY